MTGWDVVSMIINQFSPFAMTLLFITVVVVGIVGFSKHGMGFIRHGFNQNFLNEILSKLATKEDINSLEARLESRIDKVESRLDKVETRMGSMETELATIKVNHFGHLKDFLSELTSILLDKGVFNNTEKTRLDNQLRGM